MCRKKKKQPYKPTKPELDGAPRAFIYELQMLHFSVQLLELFKDQRWVLFNKCIHDAVLEAALLHARNLLEFFTGDRPLKGNLNEDSIRAGYFIKESHKNQKGCWKSDKLSHTKSRKNDINKSLSHLTFKRIKEDYKWDDLPKIKEEIEEAYDEFIQLLPENKQNEWQKFPVL